MAAIDHYVLERANDSGFTTGVVSHSPITVNSYLDTTGTLGVTYYYRVKAVDVNGAVSAWGPTVSGLKTGTPTNVALASAGASIAADVESLGAGTKARLIDGSRNSGGSFNSTGGFQQNGSGHNVEITFSASKVISEVDIIFADSSNLNSTTNPTLSTTSTTFAVQDYTVQYWNGSSYVTLLTITGNDKQWRQHTFTPVATTKMKFIWDTVRSGASYLLEVECWGF